MSSSDSKSSHASGTKAALVLTALGVVYGDIGTSPLYALREAFHGPHAIPLNETNLFGVLSLVFWALFLIVTVKYLVFVVYADNNGEGGVLALTALSCLNRSRPLTWGKPLFLSIGLFGAALLVGDSLITPAISVLSAVEGLSVATTRANQYILPIAVGILAALFSIQNQGTSRIGRLFGPVMLLWFSTLALLGLLSTIQSPEILKAVNPYYAVYFVTHFPSLAFVALASVFLVATGGEALYADLGHVGRWAVVRGWYTLVYPALVLNYFGQGALLLRMPEAQDNPFYRLAPSWALYPLVALAMSATIIASQAVITGLFSLATQCVQLNYWPRLTVKHTSYEERGQIFVPLVNLFLLLGTIFLVMEFKTSSALAGAYGIAVSLTMVITTILVAVVARIHWHWSFLKTALILVPFFCVDLIFLGANMSKVEEGGWVPLGLAIGTFFLMTTWHRGRQLLSQHLRKLSYPLQSLIQDIKARPPARVSGTAVYMVGDAQLTPPALLKNLRHNKVLHEKVVFLTVTTEEIPRVNPATRLEVSHISDGFFRVTAHYGFMETPKVSEILFSCRGLNPAYDFSDPTFFLGREIILSTHEKGMWFWRKKVFTFMSKNARSATAYFDLPVDRVVELGMQVEI